MIIGFDCEFNCCADVSRFLCLECDPFISQPLQLVVSYCKPNNALVDCPQVFELAEWKTLQTPGLFEFLRVDVYPKGKAKQLIETREDFLKSNCLASIILYDMCRLEIYSKEFGEDIKRFAIRQNAKIMEIYTSESMQRSDFRI